MGSKWGRGQPASNAVEFFKIATSEFFLSRFEKSAFWKMKSPVDFFLFNFFNCLLALALDFRPKNTCAKFGGEIRNNEAVRTRKHPCSAFFIQYYALFLTPIEIPDSQYEMAYACCLLGVFRRAESAPSARLRRSSIPQFGGWPLRRHHRCHASSQPNNNIHSDHRSDTTRRKAAT